MSIAFTDLSKRFAAATVLDGVSAEVQGGELLALLGPSGSGKTTLLRIIAGLEHPDAGVLSIDGKDSLELPPRDRKIGFVFQNYALFRHMTVADNIGFGLAVKKRSERPGRRQIAERVEELLSLVQLDGLGGRFPAELSGGQRQRVALARALGVEPRFLLLDEPFGALDAKVRVELRQWLRHLHDTLGLTTIFVTHDQEEALELADRVAILCAGRIEQIGSPREVYDRPSSGVVMEFIGEVNRLPCRIIGGRARIDDDGPTIATTGLPDGIAIAYVRPHEIELTAIDATGSCAVKVIAISVIGPRTRVHVQFSAHRLEADADKVLVDALRLAPGRAVGVRFKMLRIYSESAMGASTRSVRWDISPTVLTDSDTVPVAGQHSSARTDTAILSARRRVR